MKKKQPRNIDRMLLLACLASCAALAVHAGYMHMHTAQFEADTVQVVRQLIQALGQMSGAMQ